MTSTHFESYSTARSHFKQMLDAAAAGRPTTVRRDGEQAAVVDAARLRRALALVVPTPEVVAEAGGWSVFLPGVPIAADGATFDDAVDDMLDAIREYADDWQDRLHAAANHSENWGLVQLAGLSDDQQLRDWIVGSQR